MKKIIIGLVLAILVTVIVLVGYFGTHEIPIDESRVHKPNVNASHVFTLIQAWRTQNNLPQYVEDERLCKLANTRVDEISVSFNHDMFKDHWNDFPHTKLSENLGEFYPS